MLPWQLEASRAYTAKRLTQSEISCVLRNNAPPLSGAAFVNVDSRAQLKALGSSVHCKTLADIKLQRPRPVNCLRSKAATNNAASRN